MSGGRGSEGSEVFTEEREGPEDGLVVGGYFRRISKGRTRDEVGGGSEKVDKSLEKETQAKTWHSLWVVCRSLDRIQVLLKGNVEEF